MALGSALPAQFQFQGQGGQVAATDGMEVTQPGSQGADAVVAGGSEHEAPQFILFPDPHVQPPVGFAQIVGAEFALVG